MATNNILKSSADSYDHPVQPAITRIFTESSFFTEQRAPALPLPAEIRELNKSSGHHRATSLRRPPPVSIPSLGLFVKYGSKVTVTEAETQVFMRSQLSGRAVIPEVFGWIEDGGQVFIYMSLVQGDTLQKRFPDLNEDERQAICKELRSLVNAWRSIAQEASDPYVGKSFLLKAIC